MKRLALLAGLLLSSFIASGQMIGDGIWKSVPAASGGGCAQATTALAAMTGGLNSTNQGYYTTFICGLVSDGVWNFVGLYVLGTQDATDALVNLANPSANLITEGSPGFTAYAGFNLNSTTQYLYTGLTGSSLSQNSASLGIWISSLTATNNGALIGGANVQVKTLSTVDEANIFDTSHVGQHHDGVGRCSRRHQSKWLGSTPAISRRRRNVIARGLRHARFCGGDSRSQYIWSSKRL